nr:hypothetical protein PJ912_00765 [Pectobacterium colocasium]
MGKLFTSTRHEVSRRERLFILTPHLVGDQTDPTRYVSSANRQQLNGAMNRVAQRNGKTDLYSLIEGAFRDLSQVVNCLLGLRAAVAAHDWARCVARNRA